MYYPPPDRFLVGKWPFLGFPGGLFVIFSGGFSQVSENTPFFAIFWGFLAFFAIFGVFWGRGGTPPQYGFSQV